MSDMRINLKTGFFLQCFLVNISRELRLGRNPGVFGVGRPPLWLESNHVTQKRSHYIYRMIIALTQNWHNALPKELMRRT